MSNIDTSWSIPPGMIPIDTGIINAISYLMSMLNLSVYIGQVPKLSPDEIPCISIYIDGKQNTRMTMGRGPFQIESVIKFDVEICVADNRESDGEIQSGQKYLSDLVSNATALLHKNQSLGGLTNEVLVDGVVYTPLFGGQETNLEEYKSATLSVIVKYSMRSDSMYCVDNSDIVSSSDNIYQ